MSHRIVSVILGLACLAVVVAAMSSTNYALNRNVIGAGGGSMGSSSYQLQGTAGLMAGTFSSSSYKLYSGFWSMGSQAEPAPTVASIKPGKHRHNGKTFLATINGTGFRPGVQGTGVILWKTAMTKKITGSSVNVQSDFGLTTKFKIPKKAKTGFYNVTVINPDRLRGTLIKGFKVKT
jgi:hypothetical protein